MKKKQLLNIYDQLKKENDEALESKVLTMDRVQLLKKCQSTAILLGTSLEASYSQDKIKELIKILEEYCENVYVLSVSEIDMQQTDNINNELNQIHIRLLYDLPDDKKEVVFLPYKASMWDSLESVWKKAEADPGVEAYVIPIPYFDKNSDGSFGEKHYEGELYPEYVPVVDYRNYDFEGRHPDEIYIHNPYDDCNVLTSVHPFFYSENLRKYTDKLIYIPYFILEEIGPDDEKKIENIEYLIDQPGVYNSDLVIVQSEQMAQVYIKVLTRLLMKKNKSFDEETVKDFLKGCIKGLGSPKIEKLKNIKKEELDIPEDWMEVINKGDGSWKKIILYNIGVSTALEHGSKLLDKIERSFEVFKQHKDEVALLWRPHPLMEITLKKMDIELYKRFISIKGKYISERVGIYDDTSDVDRAIVLSDAYYGDQSSLVQLFILSEKSVMIENLDV